MAVVVTGAAGFLGQALVAALTARGRRVVAVDRRPIDPMVLPAGVTAVQADLLGAAGSGDPAADAALTAAEAVVHLAGCPGVRDSRPDIAWRRQRDNVLTTAHACAVVPRHVPLVVASSSSVYGGAHGRPCVESDALVPRGGYAASKVRAEEACRARAAAGGIVTIARPFTVAGEGQRPDMAIARWLDAAARREPLRILGSLDRTRDITDVQHAALALAVLAERGWTGAVNIGTGRAHRLADLVEAVAAALDVDVTTHVTPAAPEEVRDTLADVRTLERVAGFVPDTDLPSLVARQVAAAGVRVLEAVS